MGIPELKLKVAEAVQDDVNKGIVRIDSAMLKQVGISPGDIVEIEGKRKSVAIADRSYPGDLGLAIIRIDGIGRRNAKTSIGEVAAIRKVEVKEAKKVAIAPARKGVIIKASPQLFKQGLLGRPVMKGDIVSLGGVQRRRTATSGNPFFEEMFHVLDESLMGFGFSDLKFIVVSTAPPKMPVIISDSTEVEFNPEAVEVREETALEASYEDIGGLRDEIKKIREMVELPLKHPEVFERLGIEPPKGVLLHGPPGTGKTLLAKAVASETNSNFLLINGPEIMSKFYGQSLPAGERVLVEIGGKVQRVPIGELVEQKPQGAKALSFDARGKLIKKEITRFIRHQNRCKIMEVTTASGRSVRVTDDHSLFTIGSNGIESIKTSALAPGTFIAAPRTLPEPAAPIESLDLLALLESDDRGLTVRNVQHLLKQAVSTLGVPAVAQILGCRERYIYDIISKNVGVRVSRFLALMRKAGVPVDKESLQLSTKGKSVPAVLRLSEELCLFFGLWLAEGSYTTKNEVRVSIHESEIPYFEPLITKLFGSVTIYRKPRSHGADIIICSGALGKLMKLLGFESGARNKRVPPFTHELSNHHLATLLRGLFSGDGSVNRVTPAPMVELSTESEALADDILLLLLRFGIVAKAYRRPHRPQRRICFADTENLTAFREIGFVHPEKNKLIFDYVNLHTAGRRNRVPLAGMVKDIVESESALHSWRSQRSVGQNVLLRLQNPKLDTLLASDIYWDRVVSVKERDENPEFVYDLSVPGCENFIAGVGGIFAHNSEENLRKKFEDAEKNAPSIIFIDEIDAIASKREETRGEVERRVVAQLLSLMDGLQSRGKVIVLAATNRPNALDPALRRPGRFDREIEIGVPSRDGREDVLKIHTRNMPLKGVSLKSIADVTHGFVGADLAALAKEAAMVVLRRVLPDLKLDQDEPIPKDVLEKMQVTMKDFKDALKIVRPSAMREVLVEVPDIGWEDIGSLEDVRRELIEAVEWPLKYPKAFQRLGIRPPRGILLYGAPGTGKTLLAKAIAHESEANFILVNGPSLLSKWVGESEKAVREIFRKARQTAPTIIFFDEVDSLAPRRGGMSGDGHGSERVVNQILTEMDGLEELNDVVVIAATNRPDIVDTALLRPGRFDRIIMVPVPDIEARKRIFTVHLKGMPLSKDVAVDELAEKAEGYVGADIEAVCREAAMLALREDMEAKIVSKKHFELALEKVRASVTDEIEELYEGMRDELKKARAKEMEEDKKPRYMG